jgi:hypothetical protein
MPDPLTSAMWSSWVEINPQTAPPLRDCARRLVEVTSSQGSVRAPAMIFRVSPDVVAMPVGQRHERSTRYASKRGANPIAILAPLTVGTGRFLGPTASRSHAPAVATAVDHVRGRDARARAQGET